MHLTMISIRVKPGFEGAFIAATLENAQASRREPGIFRFELMRDGEDPCHFLLQEGYRDDDAPARHKETAHYARWKELAEPMMAEPRARTVYRPLD